ncbi:MAG: O-methyltransferase [Tidjanibacter sp.]|nr:O-methyltransferase [Tidjanibacter sp.]
MPTTNPELDRYIRNLSSNEDPLLAELEAESNMRVVQPQMVSGHVQGLFLQMLTRMIAPRKVLEIGTFTGYATLCFAAGLPDDGVVDTVEIEEELEGIQSEFFARSPYGYKIRRHTGSALEIVPTLGECYDLVFLDGDKREYPDYYKMLMDNGLIRSGSYILADNILWYGKVTAENIKSSDLQTRGIVEFNRMVHDDPRVENVIIPLRDGINLIRVL